MFIFTKEFLFSVMLLSGTLKAMLILLQIHGVPDLTLLSAFGVTLILINEMRRTLHSLEYKRFELIMLLTLFYLFMIFSLAYTSSPSASIIKTIYFGTMALAFYFPLLVREFKVEPFMKSITLLIFISTPIFLNFYTGYLSGDEAVILSLGEDEARHMTALYLTISWLNGILVLYYFFQEQVPSSIRWSIMLIAFLFLISAGGRGPLLFTVLILGGYFLYQLAQSLISFKLNRLILPVIIIITTTVMIIFIVSNIKLEKIDPSLKLVDNTVERLMGLVNEKGGGASAHSRVVNAKFSIDKINHSAFWGYGVGSYGYEKSKIDELDYPHNLFLEVWFELGYIPLLIFLLLFFRVYKNINPTQCSWCMALYFYFLLNVLKSSSLIDIRMMLGFYAIFVIIEYKEEKVENKTIKKRRIDYEKSSCRHAST